MLGRVRYYNQEKGYGYIKANNNQDVYVNDSVIMENHKRLEINQIVEFDIVESFRGPMAKKVFIHKKSNE